MLEREGTDVDLDGQPTCSISVSGGTEHLHTEKRLVTVFFENKPREIPRGTYTTEQLKHLFGVQEGYVLEFINEEGQLTPLKPGAKLRVKEGHEVLRAGAVRGLVVSDARRGVREP